MTNDKPTEKQLKVLGLLEKQLERRGGQPDLGALAEQYGASYVSLKQQLDALAKKGYLELTPQGRGKTPIIRLPKRGVPVLGEVTAGALSYAEQVSSGQLQIPLKGDRFALWVRGHSMATYINDGDVVVLEPAPLPLWSGQVCAVRLEDETTLKVVETYQDGSAILRPYNEAYEAIEIASLEDVTIVGVYVGHISGRLTEELFLEAA